MQRKVNEMRIVTLASLRTSCPPRPLASFACSTDVGNLQLCHLLWVVYRKK
uniref:Uncharacterized protein n=1 Tax=Setaria italica TaxID=4555 RepID=K4ANI4_SETIT